MELKGLKYRIPFSRPFRFGSGTYDAREGVLIRLQKDGYIAWSEAAPLSGFSKENVEEVIAQFNKSAPEISNLIQQDWKSGAYDEFYDNHKIVPSLRFALDALASDILAQRRGIPVRQMLFNNSAADHIAVNAVVPLETISDTIQTVTGFVQEGYKTIKFKLGNHFTRQLEILRTLRAEHPELIIRLDANRIWDLNTASANLRALEDLQIEYCEEPLAYPSPDTLRQLANSAAVPLALDETLAEVSDIEPFLPFTQFLILKPSVIGQFSKLFATKRLADAHDNRIIFTTALESGVGRLVTANLASGIGCRKSAHGLATGRFLTMDVWHDGTYINNGYFSLPDYTGQDQKHRPDLQSIGKEIFPPCE